MIVLLLRFTSNNLKQTSQYLVKLKSLMRLFSFWKGETKYNENFLNRAKVEIFASV